VPRDFAQIIFLYVFPGALAALSAIAIVWLRATIKRIALSKVPKVGAENVWKDIKGLTIDQFITLIELRITSLFALTSRVFMRRIRSLVYGLVYRDEKYENKRISNLIYDLLRTEKKQLADFLSPSKEMTAVAQKAAGMPTTLWFDDEKQERCLIACGQFTICYNLLEFMIRRYGTDESSYPPKIMVLFQKAKEDWDQLKLNPLFLIPSVHAVSTG
jgi:hypothetical protein